MMKLCECGCGLQVNKEENKYVLGHNHRGRTYEEIYSDLASEEKEKRRAKIKGKKGLAGESNPAKRVEVRKKLAEIAKRRWCYLDNKEKEEFRKSVKNGWKKDGVKDKHSMAASKSWLMRPEDIKKQREYMLNGGSLLAISFNKSPSGPQLELYNKVKSLYIEADIECWFLSRYRLDIVVESIKLDIEYDGSYWHKNIQKDEKRDEEIKSHGWKVLRYRDYVPSEEQLSKDIERTLN